MLLHRGKSERRTKQRGVSLVIVAASLVAMLAMAGLAIDLASLYVARSEAQRAADAAALAGAHTFGASGCMSATGGTGCTAGGLQETPARQQAEKVGDQNNVGGQLANIQDSDVTFSYPTAQDPEITVVVQRTSARGNPLPTFFMRIFGVQTADVSATATAEAYAASGALCVKPWLIPNCDPNSTSVASSNPNANLKCAAGGGKYYQYFVNPASGTIVNPSAIGELLTLKPGDPSGAAAPSKYYIANLPAGTVPSVCPSCATGSGGGGGTPLSNSAAVYRTNIECCNTTTIVCNTANPLNVQPVNIPPGQGNKVGPTAQGVDCLINENNCNGEGCGQDTISFDPSANPACPSPADGSAYQMCAGSQNPLVQSGAISEGAVISTSNSLVTVPIYDGSTLCPGNSCSNSVGVPIYALMQIFVVAETSSPSNGEATVTGYITTISPNCGGGGAGGSVVSGGSSPIAVRLIHN
jgi:Putative Flp pilus-assembly TadE/G-like